MFIGRLSGAIAVLALLSLPMTAAAQGSSDGAGEQEVTEYEFETNNFEGELEAPGSSQLRVQRHGPLEDLIEVRTHFVDEVQATVEDL